MDTRRPPPRSRSTPSLTSSTSSSMPSHGRASPPPRDLDTPARQFAYHVADGATPAVKLRNLLSIMDGEMRAARPAPAYRDRADRDRTPRAIARAEPASTHTRTTASYAPASYTPAPPSYTSAPTHPDTDDDSPPSPPPRITYARRREAPPAPSPSPPPEEPEELSPPRRFAALPKRASPPRRLPSRAIALRAAAAAAAAQEAQAEQAGQLPRETREKSAPTPLENFIASTAPPTPYEPRRRLSLSEEPRRRLSVSEAIAAASSPGATPRARPRASTPPQSPPRVPTPPRAPSPPLRTHTPSPPPPRASQRWDPPSPSPRKNTSKGKERAYADDDEDAAAEPEEEAEPEEPEPPRRRERRVATPPNSSASFAAGLDVSRDAEVDLEDSDLRWRDESVESSESSVPIDLSRGPAAQLIAAEEMSMSRSRESMSKRSPTSQSKHSPSSQSPGAAKPSPSPTARKFADERSPTSRTFATATERSQTASRTFATAQRLPTASPSFATAAGTPKEQTFEQFEQRTPESSPQAPRILHSRRRSLERSPKLRHFEMSPKKERSFEHQRRASADTSLPAVPPPESSDEEVENSALVARRNMFRHSKSPDGDEPRTRTRRLSASRVSREASSMSADSRYAALKASMGAESDGDEPSARPEPSRTESSLLGSLWKGLPAGLRDESSLDMRRQPTLAELSTRIDSTLMASALPRSTRFELSEESTHRFERSEEQEQEHGSVHTSERFEEHVSRRRFERSGEDDISVARSDFDDLGALPQSSPPRASPSQSLHRSVGKALTLRESLGIGWPDNSAETAELQADAGGEGEAAAEPAPGSSEATTEDLEWHPDGPDTTSDSWLELNAAAALNPPSPTLSADIPLESPARADSDTLPDTPPRQRPAIHRTLLRAATTPAPAPAPIAPTPLRSALKRQRFESRFAPASPSVRWSPDVLDNEPGIEEETVREALAEEQDVPSTSPPSTPPQHLASDAFSTPVRPTAQQNRTPRPPGAWGTPLPPPGLPPSTPLPPPPVSGLPAPSGLGMPAQAALPATPAQPAVPATPGLPTPRPPGSWFSPARFVPPRMSRLRNEVRLDDSASSTGSEVSVHRMAFSPKRRRRNAPSPKAAVTLPLPAKAEPADPELSTIAEGKTTEAEATQEPAGAEASESPAGPSTPRPAVPVEPQTPHPPGAMPKDEPEDGDTSWTARIRRAFTPGPSSSSPSTPITPRTAARTRLAEAQDALDTASRASAKARFRVGAAHDAWRAAISSQSSLLPEPEPEAKPEPEPAPAPAPLVALPPPSPARRGVWLAWAALELLVLWLVFRATLEYATSMSFLSRSDPFGPFAPAYAVGVRLPASLEAFGKQPPRSTNLFDLLDALGIGLGGLRYWVPT